jgi:uncharacterized damage-inducible protein DinB
MDTKTFTTAFLHELRNETPATRKCLERISENTFKFKPHETSMEMGYLALLVAEIPLWIAHMIDIGEIDFVTFAHPEIKTNADLMRYFDENIKRAEKSLEAATDASLEGLFALKNNGQVLYTSPKKVDIGTSLNHWVHHRGQLTVYMRMNEIQVPSIYGPSADDKSYSVPQS